MSRTLAALQRLLATWRPLLADDRARAAVQTLATWEALAREGKLVAFESAYHPQARQWEQTAGIRKITRALQEREPRYVALLDEFAELMADFSDIVFSRDECRSAAQPFWANRWFPVLDAISLCGFLRKFRPPTYVEIGSGNSTKFARWAIERFGLGTRVVSIDPEPREEIDAICDEVIRLPCEQVGADFFAALGASDVLFVDNSHRAFPNSDVTVFFLEILPTLPSGMAYGIHDIFLPQDYPPEWAGRMYNEQYLLATYLLGGAKGDEILLPTAYLGRKPELLKRFEPLWNDPRLSVNGHPGAAFWLRAS